MIMCIPLRCECSLESRCQFNTPEAFYEYPDLLESFIVENPEDLPLDELTIVAGWRHRVSGLSSAPLIIFKTVAHRPKDLLDIQALIESHPNLDRKHIERWVREFARLLEMPEVWDDIAPWLQQPDE